MAVRDHGRISKEPEGVRGRRWSARHRRAAIEAIIHHDLYTISAIDIADGAGWVIPASRAMEHRHFPIRTGTDGWVRLPGDSVSTAEGLTVGGSAERIVLPVGDGGEIAPPEVAPRPGRQDPGGDDAVLEGILFLPQGGAEGSRALIAGEEEIPRRLDHDRAGIRVDMRHIAAATG
jgi:hypothetical protein